MTAFDEAYYRRNYPNYARQNPERKLAHYRTTIEQYRLPAVPRRIHDVGCAFGTFLGSLESHWDRYGSDLSDHAISVAKSRVPSVTFRVGGAGVYGAQELFGVVTAFDVLEHIPDLDEVADHIRSQLLPGGLLVFVVPVYDGVTRPIIRVLDRDPTHVHKWARAAWIDWAARRFSVIAWHGLTRYLCPGGYYLHQPTTRWRAHTPAILVACRYQGRL